MACCSAEPDQRRMKFVAAAPDVPAVAVGLIKYSRIRDVNCPNYLRTFYLWTSIIRPKPSEIDEAVRCLIKMLIEECREQREHADYIPMRD